MTVAAAEVRLRSVDDLRCERARRSLLPFIQRMWPGYRVAPHHALIATALERVSAERGSRWLAITMPPRHGKSLIASQHFPAWHLGRHPDDELIACSYSADLAYSFSRKARNLLSDPRWPFPEVATAGDLSRVEQWGIDGRRGGYVAAGVGGGITGRGADILLVDDPVKNAEEADSPTYRERAWEWFTQTAITRLMPGGRVVLIGTRWHEADLIGRALDAEGMAWEHLDLPALDEAGNALWPEQYPAERLREIRTQLGARAFEALYQQRPSPDAGNIIRREWLRFWQHAGEQRPAVVVATEAGPREIAPTTLPPDGGGAFVQSWDMSFKETEDGSYVVGQVGQVVGSRLFLRDQARARLDFPATLGAMLALTSRWPQTRQKYVEAAANGPAVIQTLGAQVPGLVAVRPDGSKVARAHAAAWAFEAGNVVLPHPQIAPWVDDLVEELATFPSARHDDQVDALTQMVRMTLGNGAEQLEAVIARSQQWVTGSGAPAGDADHVPGEWRRSG